MASTHIGRLQNELERAAQGLKTFEEFRSPVNQAAVAAIWSAAGDDRIVKVAIREGHGLFYRGRITAPSKRGNWEVLADDGELVGEVTADMFASVRLEDKL